MQKSVEKCGFILEETIRHGKFGSKFCDYNTWGLLREDFEKFEPRFILLQEVMAFQE